MKIKERYLIKSEIIVFEKNTLTNENGSCKLTKEEETKLKEILKAEEILSFKYKYLDLNSFKVKYTVKI